VIKANIENFTLFDQLLMNLQKQDFLSIFILYVNKPNMSLTSSNVSILSSTLLFKTAVFSNFWKVGNYIIFAIL